MKATYPEPPRSDTRKNIRGRRGLKNFLSRLLKGCMLMINYVNLALPSPCKLLLHLNWPAVKLFGLEDIPISATDPSPPFPLTTRVSQFRFKKSFVSKRNLAKQKQFRFVSLQFRETTKKSLASLRKFRFVSLKKHFASVVSLKKSFGSKFLL